MKLEKAQTSDLNAICDLYKSVCDTNYQRGLKQWQWGEYPSEALLKEDIDRQELYILRQEGEILSALVINEDFDEQHRHVNWLFGTRPGTFHRFAVSPKAQGQGLGKKVILLAEDLLRAFGCDSLRIDTLYSNPRAIRLYEGFGMRRAGIVHYPIEGDEPNFICFEKPLTEDCPLLPLRMHPAFRAGAATPWGGEKLRTVYGKAIPTAPCGESLEISCIPGLESRDDMGATLPSLIEQFAEKMAGDYAHRPFPLLLKLIDAKDKLSVQVHPDDDYAATNEGGKLGKTEAWVILQAEEGAEIVYGLRPGETLDTLKRAAEQGSAIASTLRRVQVKAGDVCPIPAGCVHAIGGGIVLYEIQQSSDITYRFYDWDRVDEKGQQRPLHIRQALDVSDLSLVPSPCAIPAGDQVRVLTNDIFTLDMLTPKETLTLPKTVDFAFLTTLEGVLTLRWTNGEMTLQAGESVYLPSAVPPLTLQGKGRAALAAPVPVKGENAT